MPNNFSYNKNITLKQALNCIYLHRLIFIFNINLFQNLIIILINFQSFALLYKIQLYIAIVKQTKKKKKKTYSID